MSGPRDALVSLATIALALSAVPGAHAYCYFDANGRRHCTLSTATRVGLGIAIFFGIAIFIGLLTRSRMRSRSVQRTNLAHVGTGPSAQAPPGYQSYPSPGSNGYYDPSQGYAPQYPPNTYNGQSPYHSPNPPPGNLPQYAPPPGPPSAQQMYAPPPGLPGQQGYAPPPGPPPFQGGPPQYSPPLGPPPHTEHKQGV